MDPAHQHLLDAFADDRSVYLHDINLISDQALLVSLDIAAQQSASFLDARALPAKPRGAWFSWRDVAQRLPEQKTPPAYIFHMGHCGSTLMSRLIAAASGALSLREPLPLRALAIDAAEGEHGLLGDAGIRDRLRILERAWGRGDGPVVVKATSICTDLHTLADDGAPKFFVGQAPRSHIAVLLAGQNSMTDLRGFAVMRHRRLRQKIVAPPLSASRPGVLAALTWLTEALAAGDMPALDFEDFLSSPAAGLAKALNALSLPADPRAIERSVAGPILSQYSKAPEHKYDAQLRRDVIADTERRFGEEIDAGMSWLEARARENDAVARALMRIG